MQLHKVVVREGACALLVAQLCNHDVKAQGDRFCALLSGRHVTASERYSEAKTKNAYPTHGALSRSIPPQSRAGQDGPSGSGQPSKS
jgi:hypothetical protein